MSQLPSDENPYSSTPLSDVPGMPSANPDGKLTTVDWLLCIFCSGIGCIIGIVRLIQGKPSGGKMIGISLLFAFLWNILRVILSLAVNNAGQ
jgi:hypothetical protein